MIIAIIFHIISLLMFVWSSKLTVFIVEELGEENYVSLQIVITTIVFLLFTLGSLYYIITHLF